MTDIEQRERTDLADLFLRDSDAETVDRLRNLALEYRFCADGNGEEFDSNGHFLLGMALVLETGRAATFQLRAYLATAQRDLAEAVKMMKPFVTLTQDLDTWRKYRNFIAKHSGKPQT